MTRSVNLDLVRSIYADWERGDFSHDEWADPEIDYTIVGIGALLDGTWKALRGMAEGARAAIEVGEDYRIEAEHYRELDGERLLVLDRRSGRGKGSGVQFGASALLPSAGAHLFYVRDGKVTKLVAYFHRDRAFADLGLVPEGGAT
jgi:hypothetical protein